MNVELNQDDVQKVYRPEYKMIYDRGKVKIK